MDIRKLQRAIVDGLEDVKAHNIVVFNTEHLSPLFERVIIASGTSNRQTKALASSVRESVKSKGLATPRTEGEENGEWIIVDCGAAVVHLMQPAIRDYYHLEELWGEKSVKMKFDGPSKTLVKASAPPAVKRLPVKAASGQSGAGRPTAAKKGVRGAAVTSAVAKKAVGKKTASKNPIARASAAKKAPAKRTPAAPKAVVRKVVARKASSRA
jgi:ribosome-associated protein